MILAYCNEVYVDEIISSYKNICINYSKCQFCVVLGFRKRKDCIDYLKQEVRNLNHDKSLSSGPEAALKELL